MINDSPPTGNRGLDKPLNRFSPGTLRLCGYGARVDGLFTSISFTGPFRKVSIAGPMPAGASDPSASGLSTLESADSTSGVGQVAPLNASTEIRLPKRVLKSAIYPARSMADPSEACRMSGTLSASAPSARRANIGDSASSHSGSVEGSPRAKVENWSGLTCLRERNR